MAKTFNAAVLTPAARAALVASPSEAGAFLPAAAPTEAELELRFYRLVNPRYQMTGLGRVVRAQIIDSTVLGLEES